MGCECDCLIFAQSIIALYTDKTRAHFKVKKERMRVTYQSSRIKTAAIKLSIKTLTTTVHENREIKLGEISAVCISVSIWIVQKHVLWYSLGATVVKMLN